MGPDVKKWFLDKLPQVNRRSLVLAGAAVGFVGATVSAPIIYEWWNSRSNTCLQRFDYGSSSIDLIRRINLGTGVQNVDIDPDFFSDGTKTAHIINNDPSCTETELFVQYHPDTQTMVLLGRLNPKSTIPNLQEIKWAAGKIDVNPNVRHHIAFVWGDWNLLGVLIDGKLPESLKLGG